MAKRSKNLFWLGLLTILSVIFFSLISASRDRYLEVSSQLKDANNRIEQLQSNVDSLEKENLRAKNSIFYDFNQDTELRRLGVENPTETIEADLRSHIELIPYDAVLGGTMSFHDIYFLSSQWILASFSDGHILGNSLLKYEISESGDISWQVIDSSLE